jgi:uncharacterized protein YecE (DUF72 family)
MEFGRVDDLSKVDFTLPPDDKVTVQLFKELKKKPARANVYVGCAKWGRPDWIGQIYPKGTKAADFLKHYVNHFNCIELNALFYQLFPKPTIEKWAGLADNDFRFCPKFSNVITHIRRLKNASRETDAFLETISGFEKKLGTSFIQLGDNFSPKQMDSVINYLESLPTDFDVALELRHPEWFSDERVSHEIYEAMKRCKTTFIITDTSGRRDVLHTKLTKPEAFIRFVGNGLHPTDFKRIDDWIDRIVHWLDSGLHTLYFFIHQHDELHSPQLAKYMIDKLNKKCGLDVKSPHLLNAPLSPKIK